MRRKFSDWGGNAIGLALVVAVNALANGLPINGQTTAEISNRYPTLFTPAGFTFSIWALIYGALALFVIYQALPSQREQLALARVSRPFALSCLANASWLIAWHFEQLIASLVIMLVLLGALIRIYRRLRHVDPHAAPTLHWLVRVPFSLYLGWIVVATIANASAVQVALGWDDAYLTAAEWTLLKLAGTALIAALMAFNCRDIVFVLVIGWAALGIQAGQTGAPEVAGAAGMLAAFAVLLVLTIAVERAWKLR